MSSLADLQAGEQGRVIAVALPPENRQRLIEMGLTKGAELQVIRFAPLGDPIDIKVRGYHLSVRRHEAEAIQIERT
jgi:ferrous iron transport protein A